MPFGIYEQNWLLFYLKIFKFLGVDILNNLPCSFFKRYFRCVLTCMAPGAYFIFTVIINKENRESLEDILTDMRFVVVISQDIMVLLYLAANKEKYYELLLNVEKIGRRLQRDDDDEIKVKIIEEWKKRLNICNKCFYIFEYFILYLANNLVMLLYNIYLYNTRPDPKFMGTIISYKHWRTFGNIYIYAFSSIYELILCVEFHAFVNSTLIAILFTLLYNVCTMMRLLQHDLLEVFDSRRQQNEQTVSYEFGSIVKTHQDLLKLVSDINEMFGFFLFNTVLSIGPIICVSLYCIAVQSPGHIVAWFSSFLRLVLICWPGQMIINASTEFAVTAYTCLWYNKDPKIASNIKIIIMRSQRSAKISPYGYYVQDFNLILAVLRSSWSYFSLLTQVKK